MYFTELSVRCLRSPRACTYFKPSKKTWPNCAFLCSGVRGVIGCVKCSTVKHHQILAISGWLLSFYHVFPSPQSFTSTALKVSAKTPLELPWNWTVPQNIQLHVTYSACWVNSNTCSHIQGRFIPAKADPVLYTTLPLHCKHKLSFLFALFTVIVFFFY